MRRHGPSLFLAAVLLLSAAARADAQQRLVRALDAQQGLDAPMVHDITQDTTGFLWIGTAGGLYRYDGTEPRRWAPDQLHAWVITAVPAPDGTLLAITYDFRLYQVRGDAAVPLAGADGAPLTDVRDAAYEPDGALWLARGDHVLLRRDGRWISLPNSVFGSERPLRISAHPAGGALLGTDQSMWWLGRDRDPINLGRFGRTTDIVPLGAGRVLVFAGGRVVDLEDGRATTRFDAADYWGAVPRPLALAYRSGTVWAAFDRYVVALAPGEPPSVLGPDQVPGGGPLFVDREGSLWLGTPNGLFQYPEPETLTWSDADGLPSAHTRYLLHLGDTILVTTWQGVGRLWRSGGTWRAGGAPEWTTNGAMVRDERGAIWAGSPDGIVEARGRSRQLHALATILLTHTEREGTLLLGTDRGLLRRSSRGDLRRVIGLPFGSDDVEVRAVLVDGRRRLWVSSGEQVCGAPWLGPTDPPPGAWKCQGLPGAVNLTGLMEMPSGAIWAATSRAGVWRFVAGSWEPAPGNRSLAAINLNGIWPSPQGGVWLAGPGVFRRVAERTDLAEGWEVLERPSAWHGVSSTGAGHVVEEPDGTLWATTSAGVMRVPASARFAPTAPPRVALVGGWSDGERVDLAQPIALPFDRNRLQLRFAALSFRDPGLLRYQARLEDGKPWVGVEGGPTFSWVNLPAGRHTPQVRASLDGAHWSPEPAHIAFRVRPPWYRTPWALATFALTILAAAVAVYRARVAYLLGLERQRSRIAMDLHDELGSGLGSIGIISGLLAADRAAPDERRRLASEIARTAGELGAALGDIVWSLAQRPGTLKDLAARLAEQGRRLFAHDSARFEARLGPDLPETPLSLMLRRAVLLIGAEALHNAARHAEARRVLLTVDRDGAAWRLAVEDDGRGMPADRAAASGLGLENMRRRAAAIGAPLAIEPRPGGGTRVQVRFGLEGRRSPRHMFMRVS